MIYKKNAIISVYDKENLDLIAKFLVKKNSIFTLLVEPPLI